MKLLVLFSVVTALQQQPNTNAQVPLINVRYQFSSSSRDDVTRLAYAKDLRGIGQQFRSTPKTTLVQQDPAALANSLTRGSGTSDSESQETRRETLAPIVFMHFNGPKRSFMEAARPVEIKLDPPAVQYPEVQDLIKELDSAREEHEREILSSIKGSKTSFVQTLDGDVAVKVEPTSPISADILQKIKEVEAARRSTFDKLLQKILASRHRTLFVESTHGTDVVVKASSLPWKRVASLVDDLETRTDASQQRIVDALLSQA